jgi:hypothetical protein
VKRRTIAVDRLACAVTGVALVAVGLAAAAWERGYLPVAADSALTIPNLDGVLDTMWWPYALGAVALILIIIGIRWLITHRPGQTADAVPLTGSTDTAVLTVDLTSAAVAAAAGLAGRADVISASGRCRADRGQRVIELDVKVDARADLAHLSGALENTRGELSSALAGVPFSSRILLSVARSSGTARVA